MRAGIAFDAGNVESAIADLRTVLRNEPTSERALMMLGQAHLRTGNNNLAEENFRKLVAAHPNNVQGRLALARLLVQQNNWGDAEALLRSVLATDANEVGTRRMLVDVLIRQEKWAEGLEQAKLLSDEAGDSRALGHYLQGRVYQAQRDFAKAVPEYEKALELQANSIEALSGLVGSLVALDRSKDALTYLEKYTTDYPSSFHAHTLIGQVSARQKRWELAKAGFEQAISLNPSWLPAYRDLAGVYIQLDDLEGAIAVCLRGLDAVPTNDMRLLLAGVYERAERYADAIAVYEQVLEADDTSNIAANNLAALIADHESGDRARLEFALEVAQRFVGTQNPLFLDTLGWIHYKLGNLEQAVPMLEEAVQRAGQVPQLRYHLGMAYYETDRRDLAKRELQAAIDNSDTGFVGLEQAREPLARL